MCERLRQRYPDRFAATLTVYPAPRFSTVAGYL